MRIINCHIENFGKLSNQTIDFEKNLTIMNQKNGWGKSTLAAFIKVMFYGFANDSKRSGSIQERERMHYQPWQGGIYGGQLVFETEGQQYEISRVFGKKEKEDRFHLINLITNLECDQYSSNIGEELFKINQESFLKTIFIPQDACESSSTDSINAKIGNLQDSLDDINRHNQVQESLKNRINELSARRATGLLKKLSLEIANDKELLRGKENLDSSIQKLEESGRQLLQQCQEYNKELSETRVQFRQLGEQKELEAKKEAYLDKVRNWKQQVVLYEETRAYFGKELPTEEMIGNAVRNHRQVILAQEIKKDASLSEQERTEYRTMKEYFENGVPGEEEINNASTLAKRLSQLELTIAKENVSIEDQKELEALRKQFTENPPNDIDLLIEKCDLRREIKAGLLQRQNTLVAMTRLKEQQEELRRQQLQAQQQQEEEKKKKEVMKQQLMLLIPGLLLLFVGIVCLIWSVYIAMAVMAVGVIVIAFSFFRKQKKTREVPAHAKGTQEQEREPENQDLLKLENEIRMDEKNIREIEMLLREFFEDYHLTYSEAKVMDILYRLKGEWNRYQQLCKENETYAKQGYEESQKSLKEQLCVLLDPYYPDAILNQGNYAQLCVELEKKKHKYLDYSDKIKKEERANKDEKTALEEISVFLRYVGKKEESQMAWTEAGMSALLEEIRNQMNALGHREEELERSKKEKEEFESKNDVKLLMELQTELPKGNTEELGRRIEELEQLLEEKENIRKSYVRQLNEALEKAGALEEVEAALEVKEKEFAHKKHQLDILEKTSMYLENAKEQFLARYMNPVKSAFDTYYGQLSDAQGEFRMDANINLTKKEAGEYRETGFLSMGNQDLVAICLRLALIHAMYQNEKPFIIIDDSFVNLDDEKVELAKKFLTTIAQEYQVIYFTCHDSRA